MRPSERGGERRPHQEARRGPEPHGDHVLRHRLAQAYARVEAFGHDVHQPSLRDKVHVHRRVALQQDRDDAVEQEARRRFGRIDAHDARGRAAEGVHLAQRQGQVVQGRPQPRQQALARLRRDTLRVVRFRSRTPNPVSRPRRECG